MIKTNMENLVNEIKDVINVFFPNQEIELEHEEKIENGKVTNFCKVNLFETEFTAFREDKIKGEYTKLEEKKFLKKFCKLCVYQALSKATKKNLPWGSLTGIRPTKVAYDLLENGVDKIVLKDVLKRDFFVSEQKANLVYEIIKNQNCIIRNDHLIDLYINIPICPSRCSYCSFISSKFDCVKDIIDDYIFALIKEIEAVKKIISDKALIVRTIYIGGGTPSVLNEKQIDLLLSHINYPVSEFTFECGRADTITKEKLEILKFHGVTRLCINPQTFCKKTLKTIGRNHTLEQVFEAYSLALNYDFVVNMDFIAGLPGETLRIFKNTIKTALEFSPHNITIHALSLKKGGELIGKTQIQTDGQEIAKMTEYAYNELKGAGYKPYYLYRQKKQLDAQENVGYTQPNYTCIFNIDSMEETNSILACGANAITKRVFNDDGKIERCANVKMIEDYIARVDEMIERKYKLFEKV